MAANTTLDAFTGRIIASTRDPNAFEDIRGDHVTVYPVTEEDVAIALRLSKDSDRKVIVRSGLNAVSTDTVEGEGAVVLNMDGLKSITVEGSRVTVGAGVTMENFAKELYERGLFLPFRDTLIKTVAAGVRSKEPGMLTRSAGLISSYLHEIHVVKTDGTRVVAHKDDDLFRAVLARQDDSVMTCLVFDALPEEEAKLFWMSLFYLPYRDETFKRLMSSVFEGGRFPPTVDLSVKVLVEAYGIPLVRVAVAGKDGSSDREDVLRHMQQLLSADNLGELGFEISPVTIFGKDIVHALVEGGDNGAFSYGYVSTKHTRLIPESGFQEFLGRYCTMIDSALGVDERGVMYLPNVYIKSQVVLTRDGKMSVTAYLFAPPVRMLRHTAEQRKINEFKLFLNRVIPLEVAPPAPRALRPPPVGGHDTTSSLGHDDIVMMSSFDPTSLGTHFRLDPLNIGLEARYKPIPGFKGEVFTTNDAQYTEKAHQYGTSSNPAEDMMPNMIAYPESVADIRAAIAYGKLNKKKIVARSGGHQYSGLSSGGKDTVVLSMDLFKELRVQGKLAIVGVGCRLTRIAEIFKMNGVTIPHGECPFVAIGGHCQTGGYGHMLRSYGLALDYVHSFGIVLADGTYKTVYRPREGVAGQEIESVPIDDKIFWGVLGGGPNSFGILTEITFEVIDDDEHPYSRGHKSMNLFQKEPLRVILKEVQKWTTEITGDRSDYLPNDLDMMSTAISLDIGWFANIVANILPLARGALLLEMVYGNEKGASESEDQVNRAQGLMTRIFDDVKSSQSFFLRPFTSVEIDESEHTPMSFLSDAFVRRNLERTTDGREFKYPYEKRLNGTKKALTDGFVEEFVDLVHRSINDRDVRIVFQMGLGGGKYFRNHKHGFTSNSRRDIVFQVVYDVFYTEGKQEVALGYQEEMRELLEHQFVEEGESIRLIWGTYGDTDINNVSEKYYDSEDLYEKLQQIKQEVDPRDVFHTRFTVQLPSPAN